MRIDKESTEQSLCSSEPIASDPTSTILIVECVVPLPGCASVFRRKNHKPTFYNYFKSLNVPALLKDILRQQRLLIDVS